MIWFVISHPTRGILTEKSEPGLGEFKFQWSKPTTHEDNMFFRTTQQADAVINQMPARLSSFCDVLRVER